MGHVQALHVKSQLVQAPLEDVLIEVADMLRIQGPARLLHRAPDQSLAETTNAGC